MSSDRLDFYFDIASPYAWFAWLQIEDCCRRHGLELVAHPVDQAEIVKHWGHKVPSEIPPQRLAMFKDVSRYARRNRIAVQGPASFPFDSTAALRLCLPAVAGERQADVIDALFSAGWQEGIELGNHEALAKALERRGLPGKSLIAKAREPIAQTLLKEETREAIALGVYDVPTMISGGEMFVGNDRMDDLELYLEGRDFLDMRLTAQLLSRPASAQSF